MNEGGDEAGSPFPEVEIPSAEDVSQWAAAVGVDPAWAERKRKYTEETHGWEKNGRLIVWRNLWKTWFEEDVRAKRWPLAGDRDGAHRAPLQVQRERGEILQELWLARLEKNAGRVVQLEEELRR